jgi:hypothetical protein
MKKLILPFFALTMSLFAFNTAEVSSLSFVSDAQAQITGLVDAGDLPSAIGASALGNGGSLRDAIKSVLNFVLFFLGLIATGFVIYGGFLFITSAGDEAQAGEAKKLIIYAAVGIIVILISFALVSSLIGMGGAGGAT